MVNMVSAVNSELLLQLPATLSGQAAQLEITDFAVEGSAIIYGFVDESGFETKLGVDGSGQAFANKNKLIFIEFRIVPLGEVDIALTKFTLNKSETLLGVIFKDKNIGVQFVSEKAGFKTLKPVDVATNPDYKVYRIELIEYAKSEL